MIAPIRIRCDVAHCSRSIAVKAPTLADAHHQASEERWSFLYAGPGHGWIPRCPVHPHFRGLFVEQAA